MVQKKSKVVSLPRPKRKPSVRGAAAEAPTEAAQEIIISGPSGLNNPKEMKADLDMWGVSPREYKNLKGSDLRKAWKSWHNIMESREGGKKVMKKKEGKVVYKADGSKVINKKKKKTGSLPITVVDRKTGKEDPYKARRMRRNTAILEQEYIPEMATPGLNSIIRRLVNDAKRQFSSPERARAMRIARKVADHPHMQEKGLTGSRSKPLDAPRKHGGGMSHVGLYPAEEKHEGKTKATGTVSEATREENIKREAKGGGKVLETKKKKKKKKQGYKARKDESIAQRVKKKRTKKQLAASRDESYGKWGKGKGKGKINQTDGNKLVASLYD